MISQPTTRPTTGPRPEAPDITELRTQAAAMYVMLHLTGRAISAGLAAPHWEVHESGYLTVHFVGKRALIGLDAWRRLLASDCSTHSERLLDEVRWTVAATVQDVQVLLVAVVPAPARTAVPA